MSIGPGRCSNYIGVSDPSYDYYCYIPLYRPWNATHDPLDTLRGCCESPDENLALYGPDNCSAYCNATEDTLGNLETCLRLSALSGELGSFGCSSGAGRGVADTRMWGVWIVVGLVVGSVLGV
ncbi:hypothetical protein BJX63DRAFT_432751 [Aspergillus granulosus]|uniref:Uncharacterized protein n=1 Tax=Aspergillus granulosus TaxID=176169 RepID=A0ABR4HA49_9EURO